MLNKYANSMANLLSSNHIVDEKDKEIYVYGLEVILSTIINMIIVAGLSILLGLVTQTVTFVLAFALLRVYAGGYHAKSHYGCVSMFTLIYLVNIAIQHYTPQSAIKAISLIIGLASFVLIWLIAPIEHENRPFEGEEYNRFKKITRVIALIETLFIIAGTLIIPRFQTVSYYVALAMLSVVFVLALAKKIKVRGG